MEQNYYYKNIHWILPLLWLVPEKGLCVVNRLTTKQTCTQQFDILINDNTPFLINNHKFHVSTVYAFWDDPTVTGKRNLWNVSAVVNHMTIPPTGNTQPGNI